MRTHGKASTYIRGCRCDLCKAAHARRNRKLRQSNKSNKILIDASRHGKRNTYVYYGCRCSLCKEAHNKYCKENNERKRHQEMER